MDVLNNINLNGNTITSATLNNAVVGTNTTTTAGAIKYNSGSLSYYNGSSWVSVGSGGGGSVDGLFNLSDGNIIYSVQVSPTVATNTITVGSQNTGILTISMTGESGRPMNIPTTYIKTTGDIEVGIGEGPYSGGHLITITHGLGSYNVIAEVWYKPNSKVTSYELYKKAVISAISDNVITVQVGGDGSVDDYSGIYKVLIFRGYEQTISAGNITITSQGSPI